MTKRVLLIIAGVLALFLAFDGVYTVHQTQQALITRFGTPVRVVQEPGLHVKIPLAEVANYMDRRILALDADQEEVIAADQKRLVVDAFARFRIVDPLEFYKTMGSEVVARARLDPIINSNLRSVLGREPFANVLSAERARLMDQILRQVNGEAKTFGIEVVDVRIKRADLPPENSRAIYERMKTERQREAKEFRAEGAEVSQRIRSRADRERTVLLAEAQKQAEILRGEGEGEAVRIFAEAFGQDTEFFEFYRSMQAYRQALDEETTLVLSPDSEFFKFFRNIEGATSQ